MRHRFSKNTNQITAHLKEAYFCKVLSVGISLLLMSEILNCVIVSREIIKAIYLTSRESPVSVLKEREIQKPFLNESK